MKYLDIDIETRCRLDLSKCGVYRYAEEMEIILAAYATDEDPEVRVVDIANGEQIPDEILAALKNENVLKFAYNASFERVCLSRYLGTKLPPRSWRCTMCLSKSFGIDGSLDYVGRRLKIRNQKIKEGRELIRYFCIPDKEGNFRPAEGEKWERFKAYNRRDVEAEMEIRRKFEKYLPPDMFWDEYALDQEINDRGVLTDGELVRKMIGMDKEAREEILDSLRRMTRLENPNSVKQLREWLAENGITMDSLGRKEVEKKIAAAPDGIREILELRQKLARSSVRKCVRIHESRCEDGRVRGMFQFCGATRSGRFSSKIINLQNLPRTAEECLSDARNLVLYGDYAAVKEAYGDVLKILSELLRTVFIPRPGYRFIVADFSAIEARVLAWMAGEEWRLQVFREGGDIYCASARQMFHVPVEKHGVNGHLRQRGKVAELALGYGGSVGALKAMGALDAGMKEEELLPMVTAWREANPRIVKFWNDAEEAAIAAVRSRGIYETHGLKFSWRGNILFITLPSGRSLAYAAPRMDVNRYGRECVTYEGRAGERIETYGAKLAENIVQGTARDLLVYAMRSLDSAGYEIVMHVHDEVILEAEEGVSDAEEVVRILTQNPPWAGDLPLAADGYECDFYRKE